MEIDEGIAWMRSRPESIKKLMLRFPPACAVRALRPLDCPSPGKTGCVVSYFEDGHLGVAGISNRLQIEVKAECHPEWLEIVSYYTNEAGELQDEAWVKRSLDE